MKIARAHGRRWVQLLPSGLLIAVALHQILLFETEALSPWSGGGFGMFSSLDAGPTRHLHAFQVRPGLHREVTLPRSLQDEARRMLTLPSRSRMREMARSVASLKTPDHGSPDAVVLQVWQTNYDPSTLAPASRVLRALELPLDDD